MLFPQSKAIQNIINTRSLSMLGIVCLLVISGMGAGWLQPNWPGAEDRADDRQPTTTQAASSPSAEVDHQTRPPRRGNRRMQAKPGSAAATASPRRVPVDASNVTTMPARRRDIQRPDRMPTTTNPAPHRLPRPADRLNNSRRRGPTSLPAIPTAQPEPKLPESTDPVDYGDNDVIKLPEGEKAFRLRYKLPKDETRYLIVENEFKDRGGIPGLLTYTAEAGNRITIEQRLDDAGKGVMRRTPTNRGGGSGSEHNTSLLWRVDRFEARERALGEEHKFDSLRDAYPVASLRRLGAANEAVVTIDRDPWTGVSERVRIQPGRSIGPATRRKLSKTTQKCLFDNKNVNQLLDDIGPLILPRVPRRIGESWTRTRDKEIRNFGKSVTTYRLTLDRVDDRPDGTLIAEVSISGDVKLIADPMPQNGAAKQKRYEFKLDSHNISGAYSFDITHGMLLDYRLRRDTSLSADIESEQAGKLSLENSEAHSLRVKTATTAPEKPIIVGGPKPPKDDPSDLVRSPRRTPRPNANSTAPRPADSRSRAEDYAERRRKAREQIEKRREQAMRRNSVTTQPATSQPVWPRTPNQTTRPVTHDRVKRVGRPTTRNAESSRESGQRQSPTSRPTADKPARNPNQDQ